MKCSLSLNGLCLDELYRAYALKWNQCYLFNKESAPLTVPAMASTMLGVVMIATIKTKRMV